MHRNFKIRTGEWGSNTAVSNTKKDQGRTLDKTVMTTDPDTTGDVNDWLSKLTNDVIRSDMTLGHSVTVFVCTVHQSSTYNCSMYTDYSQVFSPLS